MDRRPGGDHGRRAGEDERSDRRHHALLSLIHIFVLFDPIFGRRSIPGIFRAGLALVLAVFVFEMSGQRSPVPVGTAELAVRLLLELSVGFLLGMAVSCFLYIPQLAGLVVDTQMGMTMNQIYDAGAQANLSVTGGVLNVLLLLLFFAGNGHHTLLRIVMTSGEVVPFGEAALSSAAANAMLSLFVECTVLGIKLCMPILAAELLGQVGMGVLMKAIPCLLYTSSSVWSPASSWVPHRRSPSILRIS